MGMSRTYAIPLVLSPDLTLMIRVRNRTKKPDVGTIVRRGDDYVFVTAWPSMRESDLRWTYRPIVLTPENKFVLGASEHTVEGI
jgi:hypothetical protein